MKYTFISLALVNVLVIVVQYNRVYASVFPLTKYLLQSKTKPISLNQPMESHAKEIKSEIETDHMQVFTNTRN